MAEAHRRNPLQTTRSDVLLAEQLCKSDPEALTSQLHRRAQQDEQAFDGIVESTKRVIENAAQSREVGQLPIDFDQPHHTSAAAFDPNSYPSAITHDTEQKPSKKRAALLRFPALSLTMAAAAALLFVVWDSDLSTWARPSESKSSQQASYLQKTEKQTLQAKRMRNKQALRKQDGNAPLEPDSALVPVEPSPEDSLESDLAQLLHSNPIGDSAALEAPSETKDKKDSQTRQNKGNHSTQRSRSKSKAQRISGLETQAKRLWKQGEYKAADSIYRQIVRIAGKSRSAELAYGDLFVLHRQMGQKSQQMRLWKDYLARFPKGTFADEARSAICQNQVGGAQQSCWRDYLEDFPKGARREHALRRIGETQ